MQLLEVLREEKEMGLKGGIYHRTQVKFAYNSNRIEGSRLSEDQTRFIYETNTLFLEAGETTANVNDILEAVNHFACLDYLLDIALEPLTETHIKQFHARLKANTSDAKKAWFKVEDYKLRPNVVGNIETSPPKQVAQDMAKLLETYHRNQPIDFEAIVDFHLRFERIHPFQDGNGRVGRLIMFKECLAHELLPFIIEDDHKFFYYRGLAEYDQRPEYLLETCRSAQDNYQRLWDYFRGGRTTKP